jgi:hypothetical protein
MERFPGAMRSKPAGSILMLDVETELPRFRPRKARAPDDGPHCLPMQVEFRIPRR